MRSNRAVKDLRAPVHGEVPDTIGGATVSIAEGVTAEFISVSRDVLGLTLGEIYQRRGEIDRAIETVEELEPTVYAAVSLAELYVQAGRYDDIIELTRRFKTKMMRVHSFASIAPWRYAREGTSTLRTDV